MATRSSLINVMVRAAYKAAKGLIHDFNEVENLQVSRKGPSDFVSIADRNAEDSLKYDLGKARPDYGFICEESGSKKGRNEEVNWIIDPLDGTTNFLHGIPHFAISIGLQKGDRIIAGVVYDPIKDELFWAENGCGAYLNDRRLRVSGRKRLSESVMATGMPFQGHGDHEKFAETIKLITPEVAGVRRFGAASLDLAYVAAGRYEGFWETGLHPWDTAAGWVIVIEAGGYVSDMKGASYNLDSDSILAVNSNLQPSMVRLFRGLS
jgi:myo-inositol-1(or 4)-monophosphatase